jgi:hypothetical protein
MSQRDPSPVKNRPGRQRDLCDGSRRTATVVDSPVRTLADVRIGADEAIGPTAGRQVALAGFLGGELALKLPQRFRKRRSGHSSTLRVGAC